MTRTDPNIEIVVTFVPMKASAKTLPKGYIENPIELSHYLGSDITSTSFDEVKARLIEIVEDESNYSSIRENLLPNGSYACNDKKYATYGKDKQKVTQKNLIAICDNNEFKYHLNKVCKKFYVQEGKSRYQRSKKWKKVAKKTILIMLNFV